MRTLRLQCPHCGETSTLYLASQPLILVLNCPECQSTLIHSEGETFKVEDSRIVNMDNQQIRNYIHNLKGAAVGKRAYSTERKMEGSLPSHFVSPSARHSNRSDISHDDLLNLKIDLESSMDVSEFIEKL